jgi:hypothetical protein
MVRNLLIVAIPPRIMPTTNQPRQLYFFRFIVAEWGDVNPIFREPLG